MCTLVISASAVTPTNMEIASEPMITRVSAALRALGSLNAGTPLAIASTPVSAVHPEENARRVKKARASSPSEPYPGWVCTPYLALSATGASPSATRISPVATMMNTPAVNR